VEHRCRSSPLGERPFIRVEAAKLLAHPDVEALVAAAIDRAKRPLPARGAR
jgi:hypothetical protein